MRPSNVPFDVIIVGGFGHVGLPLGIALAEAGLQVTLYDTDETKRPMVHAGVMPFIEFEAESVLKKVIHKSLHLSEDLSDVTRSRIVIVTIGTPVDEYLNPETRPLIDLCASLLPHFQTGQTLLLRSTVSPGTTRHLMEFFVSKGKPLNVAYCPERIVQGFALRELKNLPQIVAGFTEDALRSAEELFKKITTHTIRVSVEEAELAKLFSNAWRYIQFAITNQFYMIATELGADYQRIHEAMTFQYERAQDFPKAGFAAGPCLLKDTLQLAASYGNHFQLGQAAMAINEGLPDFILKHLERNLQMNFRGLPVGILGMAFKANIDDSRDSLSYKLRKILEFKGARVFCSDEFIKDPSFVSKEKLITQCKLIIVGVPHSAYRKLSVPSGVKVVDLWSVLNLNSSSEIAGG